MLLGPSAGIPDKLAKRPSSLAETIQFFLREIVMEEAWRLSSCTILVQEWEVFIEMDEKVGHRGRVCGPEVVEIL